MGTVRIFLPALIFIITAAASHTTPEISHNKDPAHTNHEVGTSFNYSPLQACLSLGGSEPWTDLITPLSHPTYYATVNHQWNLRIEKVYPLAYFLPRTARDVQNIVRCGLAEQIPLIPNSGGHSYEALSFGNNDTLVVDLRLMDAVTLLDDGVTAHLEPGALLGPIYAKLWIAGKR
ncbi:chitooligosaccharide oxidase-like isoform X2 [Folsomia candida]|uniref:chitooligosaccharide oxidase-like isoform X2 n=1 Tax=Folsomia candida TaxID=158441 RepID=UPI001604CEEE|nr:chitooligosaccharide oxidase-like isoform X2 [Folsomia candida]